MYENALWHSIGYSIEYASTGHIIPAIRYSIEYASDGYMLFLNVGHLQLDKIVLKYGCMRMPCGPVYNM